jgi:uncharacterized repeat protein (TIGR01451 family)
VTGRRTVRMATFGLLALGVSLVVSASSRAADPGSADLGVASDVASPSSSPGVNAGDAVAGGTIDYTIVVNNSAGPSNGTSFTLQDVLPHGATLDTSAGSPTTSGCVVSTPASGSNGDTVRCSGGALAAGTGSASFTLRAQVDPGEPANAIYADAASLLSQVPNDPNGANDTKSVSVNLVTRANLAADPLGVAAVRTPLFANGTAGQNAVTYTFSFTNTGPSYARNIEVVDTLSPGKLLGIDYGVCQTTSSSCAPSTFSPYPNTGSTAGHLPIGVVHNGTKVIVVIHARADLSFRNLSDTAALAATTATAQSSTSTTEDPNHTNDSASDSTVTVASVPSPVRLVQAFPGGQTSAIVTWQTPQFTGGDALRSGPSADPNAAYKITLVPADGGSPIYVSKNAPQVTCPNVAMFPVPTCYQVSISSLTQNTNYTVSVQAQNGVDFSDANVTNKALVPFRTSNNAAAQLVPTGGSTLSTCTTASAAQPVCVSFTVPSGGAGGVFGTLGGTQVTLPPTFCDPSNPVNPSSCVGATNSQGFGPLAGYNNPKAPIRETILWDSSTITAAQLKANSCGANKTIITCFPNNVTFYDEMSFTFLNFPSEPSTPMNAPGFTTHFCANAPNKGGAGNAAWARSKPTTGGLAKFNGYADSAGSACIASMSVLTGRPGRPAQKGDVQVVINLTSDSDIIQGKR